MSEKLFHVKFFKQGQSPEMNAHFDEEQMRSEYENQPWLDIVLGMADQSYLKFYTTDPWAFCYEIKRVN